MHSHDVSSAGEIDSENTASYTCPMHQDIQQDSPGKCPKCGMNLLTSTSDIYDGAQQMHCCHEPSSKTSTASKKTEVYSCPMHAEIQENKPGKCPTCGMKLGPVPNKSGGIVRWLFGRHGHNA
jgi:rubrerythrin